MPNDQFSATDLLGSIVADRFEVIEKLGEGGMGAVYKARQISMDRQVALKILLHDQRGDAISVERFRHEAYLASRLRHPNAIIIHDFGQSPDGLLYIAMEYLSGETLKDRLTRLGPMPVRTAVKVLGQTLRTIAEAHRMGLIHRDLKPDNIFLTTVEGDTDYVKVLDFGIAKLTAVQDGIGGYQGGLTVAGKIYGTPNYMSPEQIRGKPVDHQSDLYQLGVIFYEMLAGRRPFEAQTPVDVMMMHLRDAPPPLSGLRSDVPPELEKTVLRALEKDRRLRFQSGDEFLEALENFKFASGFYAVPARIAAMTSQAEMAAQAAASVEPDPPDDSIVELGQSALMDAMDFVEEKTMLEFDGGFDDPDEKTLFEVEGDDDDMMTSAEPPPGISSMSALAAEMAGAPPAPASTLSRGTPREPSMLDVPDEFEHGDPSHIVPIQDIGDAAAPGTPNRRTIAGLPGAGPPRYVTGSSGSDPIPQKPTLAGHPGAGGFMPPARPAAPPSASTIQHAGPVVPVGMGPAAPVGPPVPAPGPPVAAGPAPVFHAAPPPVQPGVAPSMLLTPATDAPDFNVSEEFVGSGRRRGGLVLKIVLAILLVAASAAIVVFAARTFMGGGGDDAPPVGPPRLILTSDPVGVEVFDSGRYIGETPAEQDVEDPAATHELRFAGAKTIYIAKTGPVTRPTWVWAKLPDDPGKKNLAVVQLDSTPPEAQVKMGDVVIGQTPILLLGASGVTLEVTVSSGAATKPVTVELGGATPKIDVALQ